MSTESTLRFSYLDSSRGIAALIVLFAHYQLTIIPALTDSWVLKTPLKLFFDGQAAVLYFFILSGYVLTLSVRKIGLTSVQHYFHFILKRILRIFPAFIFALLVTYLIVHSITERPSNWLDQYWITMPDLFSLIKQSVLIMRFPNEPELRLLPHDWTLSIEMSVSLLLPVLAFASGKNPLVLLLFSFFAIKFLNLDPFVFDFTLGVFIAQFQQKLVPLFKKRKARTIFLFASLFLLCTDYFLPQVMGFTDFLFIHHKSWGLAILLCMVLSSEKTQKYLSFKPLVFLGKISYSFYLLHLIVLFALANLLTGINEFLFLLIYLLTVTIIATISYIQIEKPFQRF